jgi:hypothetical protein
LNEPFGGDAAICACNDDAVLDVSNSAFVGNRTVVSVLSTADTGASGPAALEADGPATIVGSRIVGNSTEVTSTTGDAAAWGAAGFFSDGPQAALLRSVISANTATARSASGSASVQGAGMVVNGPLTLSGVLVAANRGVVHGISGCAQGGGIFNGVFGGPTTLELADTLVVGNALAGSPGLPLEGGGIYTVGFPVSLERSLVLGNTPDNCDGC